MTSLLNFLEKQYMTHYDNYIINPFKIYSFLKIMKDFTSNYKL